MKQYTLASRALPLDDSWDVIVVGGGPAGCTAAAAAAREGARTLLVEQTGSLGGMGTSGLVPAWTPFSDKQKIIYRGLAERVFTQCKAGMAHVKPDALDWVAIDPELLKRIYDDLVSGLGASVLFNTMLAGVDTDGAGAVSALLLINKAGLSVKQAKIYIDTTGDADLCAWADNAFHKGDDAGKGLMPATHCFILCNVNTDLLAEYKRTGRNLNGDNPNSPIYSILHSGRYPLIPDAHLCSTIIGPGTVGFNAGHVFDVDATDPNTVSPGLILGRKMAQSYRDGLAEFAPEIFGNSFLVTSGSLLGIRETRRIVGDYELTLRDYLDRRSFPDDICRNSYFIDVHNKAKEVMQTNAQYMQFEKRTFRYGPGETHGIPFRCLVPRDLKNVLVAGRSISTEQLVQGSVRVMPCCLAMGEAAGIAAALACATGQVRRIDVTDLQNRLRTYGAYLPALPNATA